MVLDTSKIAMRSHETAIEDYLSTIFRLEQAYGEAKLCKIAEELEVSAATAAKVLARLESVGLIVKVGRGSYKLSEAGREAIARVLWKHRIAEVFLYKILKMGDDLVHKFAHELEHLSDEFFEYLDNFLGRPRLCPHGNPVPGRGGFSVRYIKLSEAKPGVYVLRAVVAELRKVFEFLLCEGIKLGSEIEVVYQGKVFTRVRVGSRIVDVPKSIARCLGVEEVGGDVK